jgi:hypothetical protein
MAAGIIVQPISCAGIITAVVAAAIGGDLRLTKANERQETAHC